MLDPWTALSLAASLAQFVSFTIDLLSRAKRIRKKGELPELIDLQLVASDLNLAASGIEAQLAAVDPAQNTTPSQTTSDEVRDASCTFRTQR